MAKNNPYALKFNGKNSHVVVPDNSLLKFGTGSFSLEAIIKLNAFSPKASAIISKRPLGQVSGMSQFKFSVDTNGSLYFQTHYSSYSEIKSSPGSIKLNNTYHVVAVRNSNGEHSLYINGVLVAQENLTVRNISIDQPMWFGDDNRDNYNTSYGGHMFNGIIDEVRVWNKALTPEEVKYYMRRKLRGDEEGLVGYWPLDEGQGNIAHDLSPYKNHGTIYNAEWVEGEVDLKLYNYILIKSNNKYYTYQDNEFIEVEPTVENFKENFVDLSLLTTPTDKVVLTMEGGEESEDGKIYRKTIDMSKYKSIEKIGVK